MATSFWPQPESVFRCQGSGFSQPVKSLLGCSSPSPFDGWLLWLGATDTETAWIVSEKRDDDDDKPAETHNALSLGSATPESAVNVWDRIRVELTIAPFQTLVRAMCEVESVTTVGSDAESLMSDGETAMNVFGHVGRLGRRYDADGPQVDVRPRGFVPTLGRFMPRDRL